MAGCWSESDKGRKRRPTQKEREREKKDRNVRREKQHKC